MKVQICTGKNAGALDDAGEESHVDFRDNLYNIPYLHEVSTRVWSSVMGKYMSRIKKKCVTASISRYFS